jgi:hypothetical protein
MRPGASTSSWSIDPSMRRVVADWINHSTWLGWVRGHGVPHLRATSTPTRRPSPKATPMDSYG